MKSAGMVRKIDPLGRLVIPKEIRKVLNINVNDNMEIFTEGDQIIFKKYSAQGACVVTREVLDSNIEVAPGLILSPNGILQVLNKINELRKP